MTRELPDYTAEDFRGYAPILRETLAVLGPAYTGQTGVDVPRKTRDDLEWSYVLEALAAGCQSDQARAVARKLPALRHRESLERRHREVEEATCLLVGDAPPTVAGLAPARELLERARRGGVLEPLDLLTVAACATAAADLKRSIHTQRQWAPLLHQITDDLQPLSDVSAAIRRAIARAGTIADNASPDLGALRRRVANFHERVRHKIESYLKDNDFKSYLQDDFYTLRQDRYVLPVRSGDKNNVPGIVHGTSQTNQTIFIEPTAIVDLNNELRLAQMEVAEEERRILQRLTRLVASRSDALESNEELLVFLDVTFAMGRLALRTNAHRPALSSQNTLDLRTARHPVLVLRSLAAEEPFEVVPNHIELNEQARVIVISGPNTGGKTVALKTIGISCLMARTGLHITAGPGSSVPLVTGLFTDIGDDQSIEQDLSTFSAHVTNIAGFIDRVGPGSVVLLDELFAGTDPGQGAALATALLERLSARGALVAMTTHLEALKTVAFNTEEFANASMGFDLAGLAPTYQLTMGLPGSSYALRIARRLGFPPSLIDRAHQLTSPVHTETEPILRQMEQTQRRLQEKEAALDRDRTEVAQQKTALAAQLRAQEKREREVVLAETTALLDELRETQKMVRAHTRRLQSQDTSKIDHQALDRIREELSVKARELEAKAQNKAKSEAYQPAAGDMVWVKTFQREGKVLEVAGRKIVVQVGGIRATVGPGDLRAPQDAGQGARQPKMRAPVQKTHHSDDVVPPQNQENTVDLRGMRVDEALERLELYLDAKYREEQPGIYIIHGHGTGALKRAVRQLLPSSRYVKKFRAGERTEGGDGVTVALLG